MYEKAQIDSKGTDYIMNVSKTPDEPQSQSEMRSIESSIHKNHRQQVMSTGTEI